MSFLLVRYDVSRLYWFEHSEIGPERNIRVCSQSPVCQLFMSQVDFCVRVGLKLTGQQGAVGLQTERKCGGIHFDNGLIAR